MLFTLFHIHELPDWLVSLWRILTGQRVSQSSHPESTASFAPSARLLQMAVVSSGFQLLISGCYGECFSGTPLRNHEHWCNSSDENVGLLSLPTWGQKVKRKAVACSEGMGKVGCHSTHWGIFQKYNFPNETVTKYCKAPYICLGWRQYLFFHQPFELRVGFSRLPCNQVPDWSEGKKVSDVIGTFLIQENVHFSNLWWSNLVP